MAVSIAELIGPQDPHFTIESEAAAFVIRDKRNQVVWRGADRPSEAQAEALWALWFVESLHALLPKFAQTKTTTAILVARHSDGRRLVVMASSEPHPTLKQLDWSIEGGSEWTMRDLHDPRGHAEQMVLRGAEQYDDLVNKVVFASRPICTSCAVAIDEAGASPGSNLKDPEFADWLTIELRRQQNETPWLHDSIG